MFYFRFSRKTIWAFWGLICICISGCGVGRDNVFSHNCHVAGPFEKSETLNSTLFCDSLMGLNNLFVCRDYVIAFSRNNSRSTLFTVLDLNGLVLGEFGTRGNADDEFLNNFFRGQYYFNKKSDLVIWVCDDSKMNIKALNITQSLKEQKAVIDRIIPTTSFALEVFVESDSTMIITRQALENVDLIRYNFITNKEESVKQLYNTSLPLADMLCFSGSWSMTPDCRKLVGAMSALNQINICSADGTDKEAFTTAKTFTSTKDALDKDKLPVNLFYDKVITTNKYIYALYLGVSYEEIESPENRSKIQIFDLGGNSIAELSLDRYIYSFTLDEEHKIIYGLDIEDCIWKYEYTDFK